MSDQSQNNISLDKNPQETEGLSLDLDETEQTIIKIKSSTKDSESHNISKKAISLSTIIDVAFKGDTEEQELEFDITPEMMILIVEWLTHHNGVAPTPVKKPIRSKHIAEIVSDPWDAEFLTRLNKAKLYELTKAANFLDIKPLLDICAAKIASIIKGVPLEKAEQALDPNTPETEQTTQ